MTLTLMELCARCQSPVSTGPYDMDEYEVVISGPAMAFICEDCVTDGDRRARWEDDQAYGAALDAAGLCAGDAALDAMSDHERQMRERQAIAIYRRDRDPHSQVPARTRVL